MNAIILCGGLSTRLGDITKEIPKILLEIGDKTVLDWQLEKLKEIGVKDVVLAAGHLSEVLREEVGDERLGINMTYAVEPTKLGTGGAIKFAMQHVKDQDEPTLILNGDILYTHDFQAMCDQLKPESEGILLGVKVEDASTYGTLEIGDENSLKSFKEKEGKKVPGYINGGLYLFTPHAKKHFPDEEKFSIEYDVFPNMKDLYVYTSDSPWIDVGVPERLKWARGHWEMFI